MSHLPILNLELRSNEDFYSVLDVIDADGEPLDMDGLTWRMQFRRTAASEVVQFELSTDNGRITVLDAGQLAFALSEDEIADLKARRSVYFQDLRAEQVGTATVISRGKATIDQGVTR